MKKQKPSINKGFTLIELVIVVVVMAILLAILAPQYLRYVERARLQKDNSAIGEVVNAFRIAFANNDVSREIIDKLRADQGYAGERIRFRFNSKVDPNATSGDKLGWGIDLMSRNTHSYAANGDLPNLTEEIVATIGPLDTIGMRSNTYRNVAPIVIIKIDTNGVMTITAEGWVEKLGATPTDEANPKTF